MAAPPPPGPPPPPPLSQVDPVWAAENKSPAIIGTIVTVTVLETLFAGARLYVRGGLMKKLQLDDYIIILAVLCGWGAVTFGIKASQAGNGQHFLMLETEQKSGAILWTIVGFCPGVMSFGLPKLAVIHLLTRLLNTGRAHTVFLWILGILCNLGLLGCVVMLFVQCSPVESQWDFTLAPQKTCWDKWVLVNYAIFAGSLSAFTDLYLAVYPAAVLFSLQIPRRKKIALSGALGIGSIATVVAIYKTTRLPALASEDFSYDTSDLVIWTCVEGSTIIIAACIPILQPLVDRVRGRGTYGSSYRRNYKNYGSGKSGQNTDVELSFRARQRTVKDPNGLTFLDQTQAGSEESILQGKNGARQGVSDVTHDQEPHGLSPGSRGIVRTDVVTVSHETGNQQALDGSRHHHQRYF